MTTSNVIEDSYYDLIDKDLPDNKGVFLLENGPYCDKKTLEWAKNSNPKIVLGQYLDDKNTKMWVRMPSTDGPICAQILESNSGDTYFLNTLINIGFLNTENTKTIIDIGGHIGSFSIFANYKFPQSKIYAFEPYQQSYDIFQKNIEKRFLNIQVENCAISDSDNKTGGRFLFDDKYENNLSANKIVWDGSTSNFTTKTLKTVCKENNLNKIDLLKLDVEGAEYEILPSIIQTGIIKNIGCIVMELHKSQDRPLSKILHCFEDNFKNIHMEHYQNGKHSMLYAWDNKYDN